MIFTFPFDLKAAPAMTQAGGEHLASDDERVRVLAIVILHRRRRTHLDSRWHVGRMLWMRKRLWRCDLGDRNDPREAQAVTPIGRNEESA